MLEYADHGTFDHLQRSNGSPLPFRIKQKLCYDIGRGLSILHACGVVHGDLKHENVLIFHNRYDVPEGQLYTAKLSDFGGVVTDLGSDTERHTLPMGTIPYNAPEMGKPLTVEGLRLTDAFSFGMLVWRAFLDCGDMCVAMGVRTAPGRPRLSPAEEHAIDRLKASDMLVSKACESAADYRKSQSLPLDVLHLINTVLTCTLSRDPEQRTLVEAQMLLRGMKLDEVTEYIKVKDMANKALQSQSANATPGKNGMSLDSVGYQLGRMGDYYDAQNNLPGYRLDLPPPAHGEFLFEPLKLKKLLSWNQQCDIVRELEAIAGSTYNEKATDVQPWNAAFYIFQAHLCNFGVQFDPAKACHRLLAAADAKKETGSTDYLAQAWYSRVCWTFGVDIGVDLQKQFEYLSFGILRGHRKCFDDARAILASSITEDNRSRLSNQMSGGEFFFYKMTGGTGLPLFADRQLRRGYQLKSLDILDLEIQKELGENYEASLRASTEDANESGSTTKASFDMIYVNHKGHGLLHMAASWGSLAALRHLYGKYRCNIDLSNQSLSESPLVCACRSGNFDCAIYLLEKGANANGTEFGQEAPLHWLMRFSKHDMRLLARRLLDSGADLEHVSGTMRKDIRNIIADWEDTLGLRLTPLGRAVLMQSRDAVHVLLQLGADPIASVSNGIRIVSPLHLASVLTLPDILQMLLDHLCTKSEASNTAGIRVDDEIEMLQAAHSMRYTNHFDPLSLQSRIVRCGIRYKDWLQRTLSILHSFRHTHTSQSRNHEHEVMSSAQALCHEAELGNHDIISALLSLGHDGNGVTGHRPVEAAVLANDLEALQILIANGASLNTNNQSNLLELLASRSQTSPSGTAVAEYLLKSGITVEPAQPTTRTSALALAVQNRYFDLADLLIAQGAACSINTPFQWKPSSSQRFTVLGYLLSTHSHSSLESMKYLVEKHNDEDCPLHLDPVVTPIEEPMTAVHHLASLDLKEMSSYSQTSARIIHLVLDTFPKVESLGPYHIHEKNGTPLFAAISNENFAVVDALLESPGWRSDVAKEFEIEKDDCSKIKTSAADLALDKITRYLDSAEKDSHSSPEIMDGVFRIWSMVQKIFMYHEHHGNESSRDFTTEITLTSRRIDRLREDNLTIQFQRTSWHDGEPNHSIVDLSVLTEEKPTNWVEGTPMNHEQATRSMLKFFRTRKDSVEQLMDSAYNTHNRG